jgi:hypothetical protein
MEVKSSELAVSGAIPSYSSQGSWNPHFRAVFRQSVSQRESGAGDRGYEKRSLGLRLQTHRSKLAITVSLYLS